MTLEWKHWDEFGVPTTTVVVCGDTNFPVRDSAKWPFFGVQQLSILPDTALANWEALQWHFGLACQTNDGCVWCRPIRRPTIVLASATFLNVRVEKERRQIPQQPWWKDA